MQSATENLYILPHFLQEKCQKTAAQCSQLREIRCRVNRPLALFTERGECLAGERGEPYVMTAEEMKNLLLHLCGYSLFAFEDDIKRGFFTIEGGHRVGVAGKVIPEKDGSVRNMKYISYLTIRFAHEIKGAADSVMPYLYEAGRLQNTLIMAPPGCGKTTMLRDMIRAVSDGNRFATGRNVGVVDERSEIAGCYMGIPQNDVGSRTDVLYGCRKADGLMMLIRSMSPDVVAVDEIGGREDMEALQTASCCGVSVLATMHGGSAKEALAKPFMRAVSANGLFSRMIVLKKDHSGFGVQEITDGERKILM